MGKPVFSEGSAASHGFLCCRCCGELSLAEGVCSRCNAKLSWRKPKSIQRTWAYLITAIVLYIPANVLPIMYFQLLGKNNGSTIMDGVITLWVHGSYPISIVIFVASFLVPTSKIFAIIWLCYSVQYRQGYSDHSLTLLYKMTEIVGRWSMVDVFVVVILVALVQRGELMSFHPGAAALSFAGVVVFTMLSALSFDPRLIWDTNKVNVDKSTVNVTNEQQK